MACAVTVLAGGNPSTTFRGVRFKKTEVAGVVIPHKISSLIYVCSKKFGTVYNKVACMTAEPTYFLALIALRQPVVGFSLFSAFKVEGVIKTIVVVGPRLETVIKSRHWGSLIRCYS